MSFLFYSEIGFKMLMVKVPFRVDIEVNVKA